MEKMIENIVKALVDNPDEVVVTSRLSDSGDATILLLTVAEDDIGKVIGRNGKIARALRTVVKAASVHNNKRYVLDIN